MSGNGYNQDRQKSDSKVTTYLRGNVAVGAVNSNNAGFGMLSVSSNIVVVAGPLLSKGSVDLFTNSVRFSINTRAVTSGMSIGELAVVLQASGSSLVYSSGRTMYIINSATSAAQD